MINIVCLLVRSGPLRGHKYYVETDAPILIGRSDEANIRIAYDEFCSRKHAVVFWENNICYIQDLNSLNGTRVNNAPITGKTVLKNNDIIGLGSTELVVIYADRKGYKKELGDDMFYDN